MNIVEWVGVGQSAVISACLMFLVWYTPSMLANYLAHKVKMAELEEAKSQREDAARAAERNQDRIARHEAGNTFQAVMAEVTVRHSEDEKRMLKAFYETRAEFVQAIQGVCEYRDRCDVAKVNNVPA